MAEGRAYNPKDSLTRAQLCAIIVRIVRGGDNSNLPNAVRHPFKDVERHWAEKYIVFGVDNGYINGMGDGTFHPDEAITVAQMTTILDKILGYSVQDVNYNWPDNAMSYARESQLMNGIYKSDNDWINREEAAQMMFNALKATCVEKMSSIGYSAVRGKPSKEYNSVNGSPNTQELIEKYFPRVNYNYDSSSGIAVWKNGSNRIAYSRSTTSAEEINEKTLWAAAYKEFLSIPYHEDEEWSYEINEYALYDINKDGIPELITHGGGQMDYTKVFTYRNGKVDYVHWGTNFDIYDNGLIEVQFNGGSGYRLYTLYKMNPALQKELVYRYAEWIADNYYTVGENADEETSKHVSYDKIMKEWNKQIGSAKKISLNFVSNTEHNRSKIV